MQQHQNVREANTRQYGQRKNEDSAMQQIKLGKAHNYTTLQTYSNIVPIEKAVREHRGEENY